MPGHQRIGIRRHEIPPGTSPPDGDRHHRQPGQSLGDVVAGIVTAADDDRWTAVREPDPAVEVGVGQRVAGLFERPPTDGHLDGWHEREVSRKPGGAWFP